MDGNESQEILVNAIVAMLKDAGQKGWIDLSKKEEVEILESCLFEMKT